MSKYARHRGQTARQMAAILRRIVPGEWESTPTITARTPWGVTTVHKLLVKLEQDQLVESDRSGKVSLWRVL